MTIKPLFNQSFDGHIWRMEIDESSDILFIEVRNNSDKQVFFAAVDLQSSKLNFSNLKMPERWLTGIECGFHGVMLLHNYESENAPVHKAVTAVDGRDGKVLWADYNLTFDHLIEAGPVVYDSRIQPRKWLLADVRTGATKRISETSDNAVPDSHISVPDIGSTALLPAAAETINVAGNLLHYLDYNNYRILSLHATIEGMLSQVLMITDGDTVVYEDLLNTNIQKIQPESFIMHKNRLIYIKNKTDLILIGL